MDDPKLKDKFRNMQFGILKILAASRQSKGKINIIAAGELEYHLGMKFTDIDIELANQAFEQLRKDLLIVGKYKDTMDHGNWVTITDKGRQALELNALDDLDLALQKISPYLLEVRSGVIAAIASDRPDSLRQAADSARELLDQTLKIGAPDKEVKVMDNFIRDKSSKTGITRKHRARLLMSKNRKLVSKSDLTLLDYVARNLSKLSHSRNQLRYQEVADAYNLVEIVLRKLLLK
jgi:hypothetical protein